MIPPGPFKDCEHQRSPVPLRTASNHTCDFIWFHSITASTLFLWVLTCNFPCLFPFLGLCLLIGWKIDACTLFLHLMNLRKLRELTLRWHNSLKSWKASLQSKHMVRHGLVSISPKCNNNSDGAHAWSSFWLSGTGLSHVHKHPEKLITLPLFCRWTKPLNQISSKEQIHKVLLWKEHGPQTRKTWV